MQFVKAWFKLSNWWNEGLVCKLYIEIEKWLKIIFKYQIENIWSGVKNQMITKQKENKLTKEDYTP